ncbi:MAG: hypothetical protein OEZ02_01685 [Anaerolineae bacterium]|nr:hypothetical protein [Anaerolineae bacterium]
MLKKYFKILATPSVAFGAVGFAVLMLVGCFFLIWLTRPPQRFAGLPTAVLTIIPGATSTPPIPTLTPTLGVEINQQTVPSPLPGLIGIGSYVQIIGTGGGLNIRQSPGLSAPVRFLGYDSEVFVVRDGPQTADGFTWWFLVTPVDEARSGWAADQFLSVVTAP